MRLKLFRKPDITSFKSIVLSDGFYFSGSGLINDMLIYSGYHAPADIRLEELTKDTKYFSWPRALDGKYNLLNKILLLFFLVKMILIRMAINVFKRSSLYNVYLSYTGRDVEFSKSHSKNTRVSGYAINIIMLFRVWEYNRKAFDNWLSLRLHREIQFADKLLLDNGLPNNRQITGWMFMTKSITGVVVYRNPRIQYCQIVEHHKRIKVRIESYKDFLSNLLLAYESRMWLLSSNYPVIPISFDMLLEDFEYREQLKLYFLQAGVLDDISYNFEKSVMNNEFLKKQSKHVDCGKNEIELEAKVLAYHEIFLKRFQFMTLK
jgi:hypothetical protein